MNHNCTTYCGNYSRNFFILVFFLLFGSGVFAQNPGIKRTILQKNDAAASGYEIVVAQVEIAPAVIAGRHSHPGDEISYVLEGEGELIIDGQAPRKVKAGDSFIVPAGKIHDAKNTGQNTLKVVATYLVEKGKPLATPAP